MNQNLKNALSEYKTAYELAIGNLNPLNSIRMCIVINTCVFFHYTANNVQEAYGIIKSAIRDAEGEVDVSGVVDLSVIQRKCLNRLKEYEELIQKYYLGPNIDDSPI